MKRLLITLLLLLSIQLNADTKVTINNTKSKWTISKHLVGMHMVYTFAPDKAYQDGKFAAWVKKAGLSTARYPGGTIIKYWDWKNPTGVMTGDHWDPKWNKSKNEPASKWMSLDEYLAFVKKSGITPMFGVNILSGQLHKREPESIKRAAEMVAYVKKKGCGGAFWYIGNEEAHLHGGLIGYAKDFKDHATAMKKIDPSIKIFWNQNNPKEKSIKEFLQNDGGTSDGIETHGKWPYGGEPKGLKPGTYEEWLNEFPLRDRKNSNRKWREAADAYREYAAKAGKKNYLIVNNEYGHGNMQGFNRYTSGLLMTDLLQELFIGNWDMSCFWDNVRGDEGGLMSARNDFKLNPVSIGMDLLADAQGGEMYDVTTDNKLVYGFAAEVNGETLLYLINKTKTIQKLEITLTKGKASSPKGQLMRDTKDHWGELVKLPIVASTKSVKASLPPITFCQIRFRVQ